jgi:MFS family permease
MPLTTNQIRGFWAAWAGWTLDGMDSFIYALVLVPALRDLLPRSGIAATQANTGFYGGVLFAIFLLGWGCAFLWGPIADRFGRVRTLIFTILCYSLFTFLGCAATTVWQLAFFRFLAGAGIGGEWTLGGVFVAEEWPESRRVQGAAWMHTGYYAGTFLAALINYWIGARYGWRAVFAVGGTPALLVAFIRYGVVEPKRWQQRVKQLDRPWGARAAFFALFSPEYRQRTVVNAALLFISMVGLWAGSAYVPSSVTFLAGREGFTPAAAARIASYATMILSSGTILGCLFLPLIAERLGRRRSLGIYFLLMFTCIAIGFGYLFYSPTGALPRFLICLFYLGIGGANFAVYTLWLPEQ